MFRTLVLFLRTTAVNVKKPRYNGNYNARKPVAVDSELDRKSDRR